MGGRGGASPSNRREIVAGTPSLRSLPPRPPAGFLSRAHLGLERVLLAGMDVIEISAPHGFGKTSQLAQWYREALVSGRQALWLSIDPRDDAARLISALTEAGARLRRNEVFLPGFVTWIAGLTDPQQAITAWLAEIARMSEEAILLIDDADQAAPPARATLEYLVANAPANLRIAVSLRPNGSFADAGLLANLPMMRITARELRLREEETVRLVRQLVGGGNDGSELDRFAVELHGQAAGWPLGLRLAIAARLRSPAGAPDAGSLADIGRYMMSKLVDSQPPNVSEMLVRLARFEPFHPNLLETVFGRTAALDSLIQMMTESPIVIGDGAEGWFRLHPSARDALIVRQSTVPADVLSAEAATASRWYEERGLLEEAAHQAELAGDTARAIALAEASLRRLLHLGRNGEIIGWIERMPHAEVWLRPGLWAPAGWAVANSSRFGEARRFAEAIRHHGDASEIDRFEADLILSAVSAHVDDHSQWDLLASRWPLPPTGADPASMMFHAVSLAHQAIASGRPEAARHRLEIALNTVQSSPIPTGFAQALLGLSYLWDGKPLIAVNILRNGLEAIETQVDRRARVAATLAAFLAEAELAKGNGAEAARLLAHRSMQVNREGLPDAVIASCMTLADIACDQGRQDRAIDRIASLHGEGQARGSHRMQAAAHFALARLHARHGRPHTARREADRAEALCAELPAGVPPAVQFYCALQAALARATADCSGSTPGQIALAEQASGQALDMAGRLQRAADMARALYLRAQARRRLGNPAADEDSDEARSICEAGGLHRLQAEFLPADDKRRTSSEPAAAIIEQMPGRAGGYSGTLLTPREYDVVCHLATHMSNKEIALAMGLREETVKWHAKNLFQKLDAGDRKTAVRRARMLGII